MSTRRQRAASRANALKSTGPRTEAGKAASRFNALKHGIDAQQQIMFGESAEGLAALAAEYHELHAPANADERFLVDSMINYEWRLRRLRSVEADLWISAAKGAASIGDAFNNGARAFDRLQRMVNSCERHYHHARKQLQTAQAARADSQTSPQPEQTETTSESSASFRTNQENAPNVVSKTAPDAAQPHIGHQIPAHMEAAISANTAFPPIPTSR
jgi:hypothetical protein